MNFISSCLNNSDATISNAGIFAVGAAAIVAGSPVRDYGLDFERDVPRNIGSGLIGLGWLHVLTADIQRLNDQKDNANSDSGSAEKTAALITVVADALVMAGGVLLSMSSRRERNTESESEIDESKPDESEPDEPKSISSSSIKRNSDDTNWFEVIAMVVFATGWLLQVVGRSVYFNQTPSAASTTVIASILLAILSVFPRVTPSRHVDQGLRAASWLLLATAPFMSTMCTSTAAGSSLFTCTPPCYTLDPATGVIVRTNKSKSKSSLKSDGSGGDGKRTWSMNPLANRKGKGQQQQKQKQPQPQQQPPTFASYPVIVDGDAKSNPMTLGEFVGPQALSVRQQATMTMATTAKAKDTWIQLH